MYRRKLKDMELDDVVRVMWSNMTSFNRYRQRYDEAIWKHPRYREVKRIEHILDDVHMTVVAISKRPDPVPVENAGGEYKEK